MPSRRAEANGHPAAAPPVPEVRPVRPADTLAGLADELGRPPSEPAAPRNNAVQPHRPTPPAQAAAVFAPQTSPAVDQSLAEMAQRLEAALRRPMAQKVVAETQRVTATVDVKAVTPKGPAPAKTQSGNLEQEMASLLSKPGKT
ncbi:MAG: flagellar protein FliO/FliZ [Alphaproteobacteria bacterium]|nr:flagellar protein FliO/FliZ [Alphaproteobacteria bacterium]